MTRPTPEQLEEALTSNFQHIRSQPRTVVSVGAGWFPLLRELDRILTQLSCTPEMYSYEQVKEKFGALRCYASISSDLPEDTRGQMHAAILDAENRSLTICEECSHRGKLRNETWQRTLCDACFQESNARHRSQQ